MIRRPRRLAEIERVLSAAGRERLAQPELTLAPLRGLVVIDEIQRQPKLFEILRPLAPPGLPGWTGEGGEAIAAWPGSLAVR